MSSETWINVDLRLGAYEDEVREYCRNNFTPEDIFAPEVICEAAGEMGMVWPEKENA